MHRYLYQAINNPVYDKLQHYILIDKKKNQIISNTIWRKQHNDLLQV